MMIFNMNTKMRMNFPTSESVPVRPLYSQKMCHLLFRAPLQPQDLSSSVQAPDSSVATTTTQPDTVHFADSTDVTTSTVSHILDQPVECDVAPLQPQAPLQPFVSQINIKDPLICGPASGNLSFELAAQEGK